MSIVWTTDVTKLLFRTPPNLDLVEIVADIRETFAPKLGAQPALTWDCDDIAALDFAQQRVVIAYFKTLPGPNAACLVVATGRAPAHGPALAANGVHGPDLCAAISDRLDRRFPSDTRQCHVIEQPLTPDLIDHVVDEILPHVASTATVATAASPPPPAKRADAVAEPNDMERLLNRLSSELTARTPSLISRAIASATPKGRQTSVHLRLQATNGKAAEDAALSTQGPTRKAKGGLFWRKGMAQPQSEPDRPSSSLLGGTSASELKAVRDALYAADMARPRGLAAQTLQAWQLLTARPLAPRAFTVAKQDRVNAAQDDRLKP